MYVHYIIFSFTIQHIRKDLYLWAILSETGILFLIKPRLDNYYGRYRQKIKKNNSYQPDRTDSAPRSWPKFVFSFQLYFKIFVRVNMYVRKDQYDYFLSLETVQYSS